jgi:hypothetical protein
MKKEREKRREMKKSQALSEERKERPLPLPNPKMSRGPALPAALGSALALLFLILAALVVFPLDKDVIVAPLVRDLSKMPASAPIDAEGYTRETVHFPLLGGEFELLLWDGVKSRSRSSRGEGKKGESG